MGNIKQIYKGMYCQLSPIATYIECKIKVEADLTILKL